LRRLRRRGARLRKRKSEAGSEIEIRKSQIDLLKLSRINDLHIPDPRESG